MSVSTKMIVPKTINVGFQERKDTYTGKLAFVVYTDDKGVLRQENSWNGWRNKDIPAETFDNVPTSGFVLNKRVGGYKSGWNHRNTYCRIYDPRGFEFEIPVDNLLFILQECTSTKGKGLEGEFVYAWSGKDRVLLPVDCEEYKECVNYTSKQTTKVTKNEMVAGHTYLMKDMTNVMYLGKHDYIEFHWRKNTSKPMHIFLDLDTKEPKYIAQPGFTKLSEKVSSDISPDFADAYTAFINSSYYGKITGVKLKDIEFSIPESVLENGWNYTPAFLLEDTDGSIKKIKFNINRVYNNETKKYEFDGFYYNLSHAFTPTLNEDNVCDLPKVETPYYYRSRWGGYSEPKMMKLEDIQKLKLKDLYIATTNSDSKVNIY